MAQRSYPTSLKKFAAVSVTNFFNSTVEKMNKIIHENSSINPSSDFKSDANNTLGLDSILSPPADFRTSAKIAMKDLDIWRYIAVPRELTIMKNKHDLREINDPNVSLLRLALPSNAEVLDFRALDYWLGRSEPGPSKKLKPFGTDKSADVASGWDPPNEFDWFSWDQMGKIFTMKEVCELFSLIKMAKCIPSLKELYLNATRPEKWSCTQVEMTVIGDTILQMKCLTKIILRGMADDYILKIIGQTAVGLKHLDVSCSQFVTDKGVQRLFFGEMRENTALYLIPTWIQRNLSKMSALVSTLLYLDLSWTSATSSSRKMANVMPGCFMFKRLFSVAENEAYGHHFFIRQTPELCTTIRMKDMENKFEAQLCQFAGVNGTKDFLKFVETHPWKSCSISIFPRSAEPGSDNLKEQDKKTQYYSVITPSKDEKRVHGVVNFIENSLCEIYSIFPINIKQLGLACPKIQVLRGNITDQWRQKGYLLPNLTNVDIFCEPLSALSVISSCPNLKKVRIRILRTILTDQPLLQALANSMSTRTLEELWIAPGSFKKGFGFHAAKAYGITQGSTSAAAAAAEASSESHNLGYLGMNGEKYTHYKNSGTSCFHAGIEEGSPEKDHRIEDLVQLSVSCARKIITDCKKLRRLGNLSWWWITNEHLEVLCQEIVQQNLDLNILWDNLVLPKGSTLLDRSDIGS